jgi:predicted nucleic acid-binding protein
MADGDPGLAEILKEAPEVALPVIVLGEYYYGVRQSKHRLRYERWLEDLIARSTVLLIDEGTAREYAVIRMELKRAGRPIPANDVWISALARQHGLQVLSLDSHFDQVPRVTRRTW